MTAEVVQVLETILMLFLVILTGLVLRKRRLLDEHSTERLSRFAVDIAFPALVFTSMLRTIEPQVLADSWYLPLLGFVMLLLGIGIGWLTVPLLGISGRPRRGSAALAAGTPNWLFIPLPIATALYGAEGERIVLLVNVGVLLVFWSVGVWIVRGGKPDLAALRNLLLNPGLVATLLGIGIAALFPWSRTLEELDITEVAAGEALASVVVQAMAFVGDTTVPLAMLVTGSFLAGAGVRGTTNPQVLGVSAIRLLALPAIAVLLLYLAPLAGLPVPTAVGTTLVIISAAPVAVTCSILAEKHQGDTTMVSRVIFVSTMASVATVPAIVWVAQAIGF
ncbi:MAG: AEC family transporter [Pseudomonadales bacterium]